MATRANKPQYWCNTGFLQLGRTILRTLTNATQRLGGRRKFSTLEKLQYRTITDSSRMYKPQTKPKANTAIILAKTTCWTEPQWWIRQSTNNTRYGKPLCRKLPNSQKERYCPSVTKCPTIQRWQFKDSWI